MDHTLQEEKKLKLSELFEKETLLSQLERELLSYQDKTALSKMIEKALEDQYRENLKGYVIDDRQEKEIKKAIKGKNSAVNKVVSDYKETVRKATAKREVYDTILHTSVNTLTLYDSLTTFEILYRKKFGYGHYVTQQEFERASRVRNSDPGEIAKFNRELDKELRASCKNADKECTDSLKRLFGETDIDIQRFYKNGISKENLTRLASVLGQIIDEIVKVGTVPVSFHQKLYKWQLCIDEIPVDEKKQNVNAENKEKKKLEKKLNAAKNSVAKDQQNLTAIETEIANTRSIHVDLVTKLEISKRNYQSRIESINKWAEQQKRVFQSDNEKEIKAIQDLYRETEQAKKEQCESLQIQIQNCEKILAQYKGEKQEKEETLNKAFVLSFGKKRILKDRIAELSQLLYQTENEIKRFETQVDTLNRRNLEKEMHQEVAQKQNELEKKIKEVDDEKERLLQELKDGIIDLQREIVKNEESLATQQREYESIQLSLQAKEVTLQNLEQERDSFHEIYLINTYSKKLGFDLVIKEKKKEIKEITASIKELKKELTEIDKNIRVIEKENAQKMEAQRREQVRIAQEEEKNRKEQKARRERIQKELQEREKEQKYIQSNVASLEPVSSLVHELEKDSNHPLLQEELFPLDDDGKRIITNSIVRKQFTQKTVTPKCRCYGLLFVDKDGEAISEQRLIEQKQIGESTKTSFELKVKGSDGGFNDGNYYLLLFNFDTGKVFAAQKYRINIAFANDFDF